MTTKAEEKAAEVAAAEAEAKAIREAREEVAVSGLREATEAKAAEVAAAVAAKPETDLERKKREYQEAREKAKAAMAEAKAASAKAREEAKIAREEAKKEKVERVPDMVEQVDEHGNPEMVDKNKFPFEIACSVCGRSRWVTKSGLHEVTMCKEHARKERRKRVMKGRKERMKEAKLIVEEAITLGLFPQEFLDKWGL